MIMAEKSNILEQTPKDYFTMNVNDDKSFGLLESVDDLKIGIIGTGNFGLAIATKFQDSGCTVLIGSR